MQDWWDHKMYESLLAVLMQFPRIPKIPKLEIVMNQSSRWQHMIEIGLAEYFGIGEAIGIIATLFVILYFSRKQMQALSVDIETKVLNDLAGRMHCIASDFNWIPSIKIDELLWTRRNNANMERYYSNGKVVWSCLPRICR